MRFYIFTYVMRHLLHHVILELVLLVLFEVPFSLDFALVEFYLRLVVIHVIIMTVTVVLQLRLEPFESVFEDCRALGMRLLVHAEVFLGFHIIAVEDVLDDAGARNTAQG